jgi:hypothetical protein
MGKGVTVSYPVGREHSGQEIDAACPTPMNNWADPVPGNEE